MRVLRLIGIVLALTSWVLMLPTAPAQATAPGVRRTTVLVDWPTSPLPMNKYAYLTVQVTPRQAGRVVRLDMTGMGGPGYSMLERKLTDAGGTAVMQLFTLCPDSPCSTWRTRYRVVVPATATATAATSTGMVTVVP